MKTIFKQTIIFSALFALSGTVAFFACYKGDSPSEVIDTPNVPLTPQEKIVDSLTNMKGFDLNAKAKITTEQNEVINFSINNGQCSLEDLENVKVYGDIKLNYNDISFEASLTYLNKYAYFNYANNYFKMATDNVLNFANMLPDYGIEIAIPDELSNIDISSIQEKLNSMEAMHTPDGGYYFILNLSKDISVYLKSDSKYKFTGVRLENFYYQGTRFEFDANVIQKEASEVQIVDPMLGDNASKYQNFEPCFDLFNAFYNLFKKRSNALKLSVNLDKTQTDGTLNDFLDINGTVNYNLDSLIFGLDASILENERTHNFKLAYSNKTAFVDYNDLKISFNTETVFSLVEYIVNKIGNEKITNIFNELTISMKDSDSLAKLSNIGNLSSLLTTIEITDNQIILSIDPKVLGLEADTIIIATNFSKTVLESIEISNINIQGYQANIVISTVDYTEITLEKDQYVAIDPAFTLFDTFDKLSEKTQFRLEFSGLVDSDDVAIKDITANGGLQFDIKNQFGYGDISIVDRNSYAHNLQVDVRKPEEVIFAYNDNLRGRLNVQAMKDVVELGKQIYEEKDAHFMELFGELLSSLGTSPLGIALSGDYGVLLSTKLISNLNITDTAIDFSLSGAIIGLDDVNMNLHIDYNATEATIDGLSITNLSYKGNTYSFNLNLKEFDKTKETGRLDPSKSYLDFSDIKVLLTLGINTSKFNYYHFTAVATVKIVFFEKNIPLDIKIRNNKGKVQISIDIGEIPTIVLVNKDSSATNRYAHIYYEGGMFYVNRTDKIKTGGFFVPKYGNRSLDLVCDQEYFFTNIMDILCRDVLGFQDLVMDQIVTSTNEGSSTDNPIRYENLLNDFSYDKESGFFNFDINITELSKNSDLKSLVIKVYEDKVTQQLKSVNAYIKVSVGVTIELTLDLFLADASVELNAGNELTLMNSYIAAHKNDIINELHTNVVNI